MLELIFFPLLIQILSLFGSAILLPFGSYFEFIRANPFASEVHVLSMSEPLFSFYFLEQFLLFLPKMKICNGIYNGNETRNGELAEIVFEHPAIDRTPKQLCTIKFL